MLLHHQLRRERRRLPLPVGEHGGGGHQQHGTLQFLLRLEVLQEGQQLDGLAQAHVVGQTGPLVEAMQEGQPAQAPLLVGAQLAGEAGRGGQGIGGLLLVVLLQHRLQARSGGERVHRQTVKGVAVAGGEAQGVVEAQARVGIAEAFGVAQVVGAQLDPHPLVLHQGAALGGESFQIAQVERHPADHELPVPHQAFAQGEAAGALRQFRGDRQAQAAGQAPGETLRQHHAHPHIAQLGGCRAHQHEGLGWGELHRFRRRGIEAALDRLEHGEGPAQALEQQLAGLGNGDFPQLQPPVPRRPGHRCRHPQARVGLGLEAEAHVPQLLALGWGEQLQAGPGRCHPACHRLAPVVGGDGEALQFLLVEGQMAIPLAQGLLPGQQQGVETVAVGFEAGPQLSVEQGLQQAGHPQAAVARAAAGQHGVTVRPGGQGTGRDLGQTHRQLLQAAPVALAVQQGQPAGAPLLDLGEPASPGDQAQGPALQVRPPAQVVAHVRVAAGQGKAAQPFRCASRVEGPALHLPGPPFQLAGDRFARLQGQPAPELIAGIAAPAGRLGAAGQGEGGPGRSQGLTPVAVVVEPVGDFIRREGQGMVGGAAAGLHRADGLPGVAPQKQASPGPFGGEQPGGMQQGHPRVFRAGGPTGRLVTAAAA